MHLSVVRTIIVLFLCLIAQGLIAQKPASLTHEDRDFREGMALFDRAKYGAAQPYFTKVINRIPDKYMRIHVDARYMQALCALRLYHRDTEHLMSHFIKEFPESKWVTRANFELGRYSFERRQYPNAVKYLDKITEADVEPDELVEYRFKKGYANYRVGDLDRAHNMFYLVKDEPGDFQVPATYYYSHIAYERGNYQVALENFQRIQNDPSFKRIVPYYIAQIYFMQKRYDELLEYAPALLDTTKAQKSEDIAKLIGVAYFEKEMFEEAFPYLEQHYLYSGRRNRQDAYQLGYALYRTGEFARALERFSEVSEEDDLLSQMTAYHMGHAYLALDQKPFARNAFQNAASYEHDLSVTEDALFSYAKLAYELSFDPFHEAIRALRNYLEKYPNSPRNEEAYEFLLDIYISTRNFEAALDALDRIENKNFRVRSAYQMVAFNQGVQLFQRRRFRESLDYFARVNKYPIDPKLNALSVYWMAEANYQLKEYDEAAKLYSGFLQMPGAFNSGVYEKAYYGLGYCQFMNRQYAQAAINLRKYVESAKPGSRRVNDALLRIGDCYIVEKDYPLAVKYYERALQIGQSDNDYALHQMGLAFGLMRDETRQVATFRRLISEYPSSPLVVGARFQLGNVLMSQRNYSEALTEFNQIIENYSGNVYVRRALLQKGLIQIRQQNFENALATFKMVVEQFPTLGDSREAIARIEDIYVELGRIDEYNSWVSGLKFYDVTTTRLDSITYAAAENKYVNGDCEGAIGGFRDYLEKYSGGLFALNANFYMAECLFEKKRFEESLVGYNYVIDQPLNKFSESALLAASSINYNLGHFETALDQYAQLEKVAEFKVNALEALIGQLRCNYKLGYYTQALKYADAVLQSEGIPATIITEALLIQGKVHFDNRDFELARTSLSRVHNESKGSEGAEAKYRLCRIDFEQEAYKPCEACVFELIKEYPGYEFWKIKALILLADAYVATDDTFQAKAVLQNILNNTEDPKLREEASSRLNRILDAEKAAAQPEERRVMQLDLGDEDSDTRIFDEMDEEEETERREERRQRINPQTDDEQE